MNLAQLGIEKSAKVVRLNGEGAVKRRIMKGASAKFTAAPSEDRKQLIEDNLFSARGLTRPRPIADPGKAFRIIPKIHRPRQAEMT